MRRPYLLFAALASLAIAPGASEASDSLSSRIDMRGVFETEAAVEFENGDLQKLDMILSPEATVNLAPLGRLTAIGRARLDPADELEPGAPSSQDHVRGPGNRRLFLGEVGDLELREFYLDSTVDDLFLRLGKQQIVWGQADGLRVLDVVNPMHYREFILPDFEDRRIPLWSALLEAPLGPATAQFVWIPDHTYDDVPSGDAAFAPTSPRLAPDPGPELLGGTAPRFRPAERPNVPIMDDDFGARVTAFVEGWDLSASYLYHYRDEAAFRRDTDSSGGLVYTPTYYRSHLFGLAAANAFGDITLRTEVGYSSRRRFITNDASDADGLYDTGELSYVLGLDYRADSDVLISGQLFQSLINDPPAGATRDRLETTVTLRLNREFLNDTLTFTGLFIQSLNDGDGLLQLELSHRLRTNVTVAAGLDLFYGDADGLYGQFGSRDRVLASLTVAF